MSPMSQQTLLNYIVQHNEKLEERQAMKRYRESLSNGSIGAAVGPPINRLRQVSQRRYTGNMRFDASLSTHLKPPIEFWVTRFRGPGFESFEESTFKGIKLSDVLAGNINCLIGAGQSQWLSDGLKASIRLRVDNHKDYGQQIAARRSTPGTECLPLSTIVRKVAEVIKSSMPLVNGKLEWRLSNGDVAIFEELLLLELQHVTQGSWQPVLAYPDPS
ncbi:hypothetical protein NM688_g4218 [Phlebia brevispora]|uniref:Uncharacterized protein n=1 Tax=Phlebia brevispora TaxID=194682 RepID=A0ACC1T395_9APHY|nr:hypothetical protein NM688_g4218 [Phlebia brevispora]